MLWAGMGRHRPQLHSSMCLAVYGGLSEHWIWLVTGCAHATASRQVCATKRARPAHVPYGGPVLGLLRPEVGSVVACGTGPDCPVRPTHTQGGVYRPGWQACCFHLLFILCTVFLYLCQALNHPEEEDLNFLKVPTPRAGVVQVSCCAKMHKLTSESLV